MAVGEGVGPLSDLDFPKTPYVLSANGMVQKIVLEAVVIERISQDAQWGGEGHDDKHHVRDWIAFIVAYLGKATNRESNWGRNMPVVRRAFIKVAALAIAAVEAMDRKRDPA